VYHDIRHIYDGLEQADVVAGLLDYPDDVRLAIIYHDIIYEFSKNGASNEVQSAARAMRDMRVLGFPEQRVHRVKNLIAITEEGVEPITNDEKFMRDIDYSNIGRS